MAARKSINSRSKKLAFLLMNLAVVLSFVNSSNAQNVDQNIINQQDWITRQQQNKIEEDRRLREQETIRKDRLRKKKEVEEEGKKQTPISGKPAECFPIKSIALIDANSVRNASRRSWLRHSSANALRQKPSQKSSLQFKPTTMMGAM